MAKIRRTFARSDRTIGVQSGVGAQISPSAATAPARALARGAKEVGAVVSSALQKKAKRDSAIIVADRASKIQENTLRDVKEAQLNSRSNLDSETFSGQVQDLDLIVNTATGGENNDKAYSDYVMSRYDERSKESLAGVAGPVRDVLAGKLSSLRLQTLRDALAFESRETRRIRRNHARDVVDRNGRAVFDNPLIFDEMLSSQNAMIDAAQIGQGDQKNTKGVLANDLAGNAMRGLINLDPMTAQAALKDKSSTIRKNLTPEQITSFKKKAETAEANVVEEQKQRVDVLLDQSKQSLQENGTAVPGMKQMLRETYEGEELLGKMADLEAHRITAPDVQEMRSANLDDVTDIFDKAMEKKMIPAVREKASALLKAEVNKQIIGMQSDPAAVIRSDNPEAFEKFGEDDIIGRYSQSLRLQEVRKVAVGKQRGMTNTERDGFIRTINNAAPDQLLQLIGGLKDQLRTTNSEVDHSFRFFKELLDKEDGLSPLHYMFVHNSDLPVSQEIVDTLDFFRQRGNKKELKLDESRDNFISDIRTRINKGLDSWAGQTIGPEEEWKRTVGNVRESAVQLTEYYMSQFGLPVQQAVNRSINGLVGDHVIDDARKSRVIKNLIFEGTEIVLPSGDKATLMSGRWMTKKDGQWVPLEK